MADSKIQDLTLILHIAPQDSFPLEHDGEAFRLQAQTLINWVTSAADGHGGFRDTFTKVDENGLVDIYEATLADGTKNQITVTNGDSGVHIGKEPVPRTANVWLDTTDYKNPVLRVRYSQDGPWQAIESTTGEPARLIERKTEYQYDPQGVNIPTNPWLPEPPPPLQGMYLWTRVTDVWNKEKKSAVTYTVAYQGQDGIGTVNSFNGIAPDPKTHDIKAGLKDIKGDASHRTVTDQEKETWNGGVTTAGNALPKVGGTMSGNLDMNQNKVLNLPEPVNDGDAANKGYVDGMKSFDELWKYSGSLSNFNPTTITIEGLKTFRFIAVDVLYMEGLQKDYPMHLFTTSDKNCVLAQLGVTGRYFQSRIMTISGNRLIFEDGHTGATASEDFPVDNSRVIPLAIYGIK